MSDQSRARNMKRARFELNMTAERGLPLLAKRFLGNLNAYVDYVQKLGTPRQFTLTHAHLSSEDDATPISTGAALRAAFAIKSLMETCIKVNGAADEAEKDDVNERLSVHVRRWLVPEPGEEPPVDPGGGGYEGAAADFCVRLAAEDPELFALLDAGEDDNQFVMESTIMAVADF